MFYKRPYLAILFLLILFPTTTVQAADTYGCILIVDGLRGDKALEYALNGTMPNVKEHFLDRGIWVDRASSVAPSITGAALPSIVTGAFPGRHNLPSLTWFDRTEERYYDLYALRDSFKFNKLLDSNRTRTLFEFFPEDDDSWSFGLPLYRGADNSVSIAWTLGYKPYVYRIHLSVAFRKLKKILTGQDAPRLTMAYSGWFDHKEHLLGVDPPEMLEHYQSVDWMVGKAIELYKECGLYDKTYFVLVSDHGQQEFSKRFDTVAHFGNSVPAFRPKWMNIPFVSLPWSVVQAKDYGDFIAVVPATDAKAFVYVAGNGSAPSWSKKPTYEELRHYPYKGGFIDFVKEAVSFEPVEICAVPDKEKGLIRIFGENGSEGTILRLASPDGYLYRYSVKEGFKDPLAYLEHEGTGKLVCRNHKLDSDHTLYSNNKLNMEAFLFDDRQWLEAAAESSHPDAIVQLTQLFDSKRAPDLFLSPKPGCALVAEGDDVSSHGSIGANQMHATFAISGPGLKSQHLLTARTVDVAPTMLHCLNLPHSRAFFDGHVLSPVAEELPAPPEAPAPQATLITVSEGTMLEDELDAINDELFHKLISGESFSEESVLQIISLLRDIDRPQRQRFSLFIRQLVKTLGNIELAEELLSMIEN